MMEAANMRVAKINPYKDFGSFNDRINKFLNFPALSDFFAETEDLTPHKWAPAVDVTANDDAYIVRADIPGVKKEDLKVDITNNTLTIKGERKKEEKIEEDKYVLIERSYGSFSRSFTLPPNVDVAKIKANYDNGVLDLILPKKEDSKPKEIAIEVK